MQELAKLGLPSNLLIQKTVLGVAFEPEYIFAFRTESAARILR